MVRTRPFRLRLDAPIVTAAAFILVATYVIAAFRQTTYEVFGTFLLLPLLVLVSLPILARQAKRENDPQLFQLLCVALAVKLGGTLLRYYFTRDVYLGVADATVYHQFGIELSERFRAGVFDTGLASLTSTDFIRFMTGVVETVTGPTMLGASLVFSWLGYWGLFLFYRAFVIAVPMGRNRSYALLLFFLPTLVFWPSSIGKESWMVFTLGIAALGAAHVLTRTKLRGLALITLGLWLAAIVRPHIAGIFAIALAVAFLLRRWRSAEEGKRLAGKVLLLVAIVVFAVFFSIWTDRYLKQKGIETARGAAAVFEQAEDRTTQGGSEFSQTALESPGRAPIAILTVLFRPLPFEARNAQAMLSALESLFLIGISIVRFRWIGSAFRSMRVMPYVGCAIGYVVLFIFAFSGIANFGLLVRQRAQVLPFYLVLLAIPPLTNRGNEPVDVARATGRPA